MKPAAFEYHRPRSVEEALEILARHGHEAKLLAGGQSLVPAMNFRLARPRVLVDLNAVQELAYVRAADPGRLLLGAMTRQRTLERSALTMPGGRLLKETVVHVAHPQIRNRGTLGGSVAHADPAAELPAALLALDARFRLRGPTGERHVEARDFFRGLFDTALEPDELLVEIEVPAAPDGAAWAFDEVVRRHGDYALVGVAAVLTLAPGGRCDRARIALLSVDDRPVRATRAEEILTGEASTSEAIAAAAEAAAHHDIEPVTDVHASAGYRRHLTRVLVRRVLTRAVERGAGGAIGGRGASGGGGA